TRTAGTAGMCSAGSAARATPVGPISATPSPICPAHRNKVSSLLRSFRMEKIGTQGGFSGVRVIGSSGVQVIGCSGVQVIGCSGDRVPVSYSYSYSYSPFVLSGARRVRVRSRHPNTRTPEHPNTWTPDLEERSHDPVAPLPQVEEVRCGQAATEVVAVDAHDG